MEEQQQDWRRLWNERRLKADADSALRALFNALSHKARTSSALWERALKRPPHLGAAYRHTLWRRRRDSNPRYLSVRRFSRPVHSTALPLLRQE